MHRFTLPVLPSIKATRPGASKDHFMLGDMSEFVVVARDCANKDAGSARWFGNVTFDQACDMAVRGDASAVAESDAMLDRMEALFPAPTARRAWLDDVTGAIPNVPAYLAGQPLNMRRRVRDDSTSAPLAIVVDLTSSAVISAEDVRKRGVAVLALVRALAARRPVELYVGTGLDADNKRNAVWSFARIDTAPIDLTRAAHLISHPSVPRHVFYNAARHAHGYSGGWPYNASAIGRASFAAIIGRALPHITDVLAVPAIHKGDAAIADPVAWIEAHVRQFGDAELADAA